MLTFKKSFRRVVFYILGFLVTLGLFIYFLILNIQNKTFDRDFYLLIFAFVVLFGATLLVIVTYIVRPRIILEVKDDTLYVGKTRRTTEAVSLNEVVTFGKFRNTLAISLKNNQMYAVRFIDDPAAAQQQLGDLLTKYISENAEKYYAEEETTEQTNDEIIDVNEDEHK